ncbi:MAG: WXG100 family type VII secretion target [Actinomyces dentalis]|jgi:WXG100 family type VII secretion target
MDLRVNAASLSTAAGDLRSGATGIQTALDNMDSELSQLQSNWDGDAQQAYLVAKQQWTEGMNGMREVLALVGQLVDEANESYTTTDQSNAHRFELPRVSGTQ